MAKYDAQGNLIKDDEDLKASINSVLTSSTGAKPPTQLPPGGNGAPSGGVGYLPPVNATGQGAESTAKKPPTAVKGPPISVNDNQLAKPPGGPDKPKPEPYPNPGGGGNTGGGSTGGGGTSGGKATGGLTGWNYQTQTYTAPTVDFGQVSAPEGYDANFGVYTPVAAPTIQTTDPTQVQAQQLAGYQAVAAPQVQQAQAPAVTIPTGQAPTNAPSVNVGQVGNTEGRLAGTVEGGLQSLINTQLLNPEQVSQMKEQQKESALAMQRQALQGMGQNAAARGFTGPTAANEAAARQATIAQVLGGYRETDLNAIAQNRAAQERALAAGTQYQGQTAQQAIQTQGLATDLSKSQAQLGLQQWTAQTAAQQQAEAQRLEAEKASGSLGLQAAQQNNQAGLSAAQLAAQQAQFGSQQGLANAQYQTSTEQQNVANQMQAAQQNNAANLAGAQLTAQQGQFGANLDLQQQQALIQQNLTQGDQALKAAGINQQTALTNADLAMQTQGLSAAQNQQLNSLSYQQQAQLAQLLQQQNQFTASQSQQNNQFNAQMGYNYAALKAQQQQNLINQYLAGLK